MSLDPHLMDSLVFTHVVAAGSFSGAAREIGLPQSSVSRRVARLEAHLQVTLLHRTTRSLSLTDAGRQFHADVSQAFEAFADATARLSEHQIEPSGTVRVTFPRGMPELGRLTARFLEAQPAVTLQVDVTNRRVDLIAEGVDVAFRTGRLLDSGHIAHKLDEPAQFLVASPDYLRRCGTPRTIPDLREHDAIMFPLTASGWSLGEPGKKPAQVRPRVRVRVNDLDIALQLTLAGFGIAQFPEAFCQDELDRGELVAVLQGCSPPAGPLWLLYPSKRYVGSAPRAFIEFVKESFRSTRPST